MLDFPPIYDQNSIFINSGFTCGIFIKVVQTHIVTHADLVYQISIQTELPIRNNLLQANGIFLGPGGEGGGGNCEAEK